MYRYVYAYLLHMCYQSHVYHTSMTLPYGGQAGGHVGRELSLLSSARGSPRDSVLSNWLWRGNITGMVHDVATGMVHDVATVCCQRKFGKFYMDNKIII
jgi:hypothetical protein